MGRRRHPSITRCCMNETERRILAEKDPGRRMSALVRHYGEQLYAVIRPIVKTHADTDDVLQETLLKIHLNWDKFRGQSGLFTWMYRIAVNEALQFLRRKYQSSRVDDPELHRRLLENMRADPWYNGDDILFRLEQILLTLPPRQQEVFRLKYFGGYKFKEMAEMLDLSEGALKTHYHLAVKKIKEAVGEMDLE